MVFGVTLLVSPIRMGSSGLEHQSPYSLMGEYGFIDALGPTFICVVGNVEISDPRNTERPHFHSCTVHLDTIEVFYLPTDAQ